MPDKFDEMAANARIERLEAAIREELRRLEPFTIHSHGEAPCERPACLAYQRLKTALEE